MANTIADMKYILQKLWVILTVERPSFISDALNQILQLVALVQVLFVGIVAVQAIIFLLQKKWKRAAIATLVAIFVYAFRFYIYPTLITQIPYFI